MKTLMKYVEFVSNHRLYITLWIISVVSLIVATGYGLIGTFILNGLIVAGSITVSIFEFKNQP